MGECLRFLWKHRQKPINSADGQRWYWAHWDEGGTYLFRLKMPSQTGRDDSGCDALSRVLVTWPQHKHLLINALEKETVT